MNRRYPQKDIKMLWGLSAGRCAYPGCRQLCILPETEVDQQATIGKIAHIKAHSDEGPRAYPELTLNERDCYENWILLCGTHHDMVDAQPNTFGCEVLYRWKMDHERWVKEKLAEQMPKVTFAELEIVCEGILSAPNDGLTKFTLTDLQTKINKNGLRDRVIDLIKLGLGKAGEVETFVQHMAKMDYQFPERLASGFKIKYNELVEHGLVGNDLFMGLYDFAGGGSNDLLRLTSGLAVLTYLFQLCEVFEP